MPEAPQGALRAVFAGIGRILNISDKVRNKPADAGAHVNGTTTETAEPETTTPEPAAPETSAAPETVVSETSAAPETVVSETSPAPETVVSETSAAPETVVSETSAAPETVVSETSAAPETVVSETSAAPETAAPGATAELPLPNYDELTIASVRARLRNLSIAQLGELVNYEKAHADRADFIAMFERRIAKVESGK
jgi:hypothetical protein